MFLLVFTIFDILFSRRSLEMSSWDAVWDCFVRMQRLLSSFTVDRKEERLQSKTLSIEDDEVDKGSKMRKFRQLLLSQEKVYSSLLKKDNKRRAGFPFNVKNGRTRVLSLVFKKFFSMLRNTRCKEDSRSKSRDDCITRRVDHKRDREEIFSKRQEMKNGSLRNMRFWRMSWSFFSFSRSFFLSSLHVQVWVVLRRRCFTEMKTHRVRGTTFEWQESVTAGVLERNFEKRAVEVSNSKTSLESLVSVCLTHSRIQERLAEQMLKNRIRVSKNRICILGWLVVCSFSLWVMSGNSARPLFRYALLDFSLEKRSSLRVLCLLLIILASLHGLLSVFHIFATDQTLFLTTKTSNTRESVSMSLSNSKWRTYEEWVQ